jgi:hypothetical protein
MHSFPPRIALQVIPLAETATKNKRRSIERLFGDGK